MNPSKITFIDYEISSIPITLIDEKQQTKMRLQNLKKSNYNNSIGFCDTHNIFNEETLKETKIERY